MMDTNALTKIGRGWGQPPYGHIIWVLLIIKIQQGVLFSDATVLTELKQGNDRLMTWAEELGEGFFLKPDPEVRQSRSEIRSWLKANHYDAESVEEFMKVADSYLIAQAHANNYTVVTQEVRSNSKMKIKIPNVCDGLGVECINMETLLGFKKEEFDGDVYPDKEYWDYRKGVIEMEYGGQRQSMPICLVKMRRKAHPKQFPPQLP